MSWVPYHGTAEPGPQRRVLSVALLSVRPHKAVFIARGGAVVVLVFRHLFHASSCAAGDPRVGTDATRGRNGRGSRWLYEKLLAGSEVRQIPENGDKRWDFIDTSVQFLTI